MTTLVPLWAAVASGVVGIIVGVAGSVVGWVFAALNAAGKEVREP